MKVTLSIDGSLIHSVWFLDSIPKTYKEAKQKAVMYQRVNSDMHRRLELKYGTWIHKPGQCDSFKLI